MKHTIKTLPQSELEITITVPVDEYKKDLEKAATTISERTSIKGFRKGKAPYDMVKKEVGEMAILNQAVESVIQSTYFKVVTEEKLDTIGMPKINVSKLAPDNDIEYVATVATLPEVTVPELSTLKTKKQEAKVDEKKVDETIDALRGMHATEIKKDGPAEGTDKLVLDMHMKHDGVDLEGGHAHDYQVYLSEDHYLPGFNKEVEGMRAGEKKTFTLDFPKDHYQKQFAGKSVEVTVDVKEVFERQLPEVTDEFAKALGQESAEALREIITKNVTEEAEKKAAEASEIAVLDELIEKSTIGEIPQVLIDNERQKMFNELLRDLERMGVSVEQYLNDIKKTEEDLFNDFKEQATKRAKTALISRQIAKQQGVEVKEEELKAELDKIREMYKDNEEAQKNINRPEVQDTIATTMQNKKVMEYVKEQVFGKEA